jgi:23S rRNA pseudouridine1911/1915/1917 synthase
VLTKFEFQVEEKFRKSRLDYFLTNKLTNISKIYLRELFKEGKCQINGFDANSGILLKTNDFVELELEYTDERRIEPENIPLEIIYEDSEFLVVNKPAEMLIHPSKKVRSGTLYNGLLYYLNLNNEAEFIKAGLVHRLDKATSGLVVIAKNPQSLTKLCDHFQRKLVEKKYFAVVNGIIEKDEGTIIAPIGRYEESRFWDIKLDGKYAETNYWVKQRFADKTLLELEPVTGRTNQLRIHLAHIGHAILGDKKYKGEEFPRMCLHAYKLNLWHPNGEKRLHFETKIPDDFYLSKPFP